MITDARTLSSGDVIQADICVVGAGPAGISIARALAGAEPSVVVLESGGFTEEPDTTALNDGDVIGDPILDYFSVKALQETRARFLGGTSNLWGGFCRPLMPIDFETRPYQPVAGWPLSRTDLDPWYVQAHALAQLGPYNYDASWWATQLGVTPPFDLGTTVTTNIIQKNPTRFGEVHRPALSAATNISLLHHANVTEIVPTPAGDHVDHLVMRTLTGVACTVQATAYVIATGGIELPRLLLASNGVVPNGIANSSGLVGRYFADHAQVVASFVPTSATPSPLYRTDSPTFAAPTPENPNNTVHALGVIELSEATLRSEGLPQLHLESFVEDAAYPPAQTTGIAIAQVSELFKAQSRSMPNILGATVFFEPVLDIDSRVRISPTTRDALGMPVAQLDHHRSPLDAVHLSRGMQLLGEAFGASGVGRVQFAGGWVTPANPSPPPPPNHLLPYLKVSPVGNQPGTVPFGTTYHHMCTARMDLDPAHGVVDADCRTHDVDNLYLAGSAVFPTAPGSHPTLTIVALALRLADHLRQVLEGTTEDDR